MGKQKKYEWPKNLNEFMCKDSFNSFTDDELSGVKEADKFIQKQKVLLNEKWIAFSDIAAIIGSFLLTLVFLISAANLITLMLSFMQLMITLWFILVVYCKYLDNKENKEKQEKLPLHIRTSLILKLFEDYYFHSIKYKNWRKMVARKESREDEDLKFRYENFLQDRKEAILSAVNNFMRFVDFEERKQRFLQEDIEHKRLWEVTPREETAYQRKRYFDEIDLQKSEVQLEPEHDRALADLLKNSLEEELAGRIKPL